MLRLAGGTREETDATAGQLHLLEHLLLRRTAQRTPEALADCIASLGGEVNAETGREHLALLGRAPAARVPELAALLVECLCEPALDDTDLALERGAMAAERTFLGQMPPMEALLRLAWPAHPLGRPLLPTDAPHADAATLRALWSAQAVGARLTVAVSGAFDAAVVHAALAPFGELPPGAPPPAQAAPRFVPGRYGELPADRSANLLWALPARPSTPRALRIGKSLPCCWSTRSRIACARRATPTPRWCSRSGLPTRVSSRFRCRHRQARRAPAPMS